MYSFVGNLALDLLSAINSKVLKEIPDIQYSCRVDDVSVNRAVYSVSYSIPKHNVFCILEINVIQYDPPDLCFEVYADYREYDFKKPDLHKINIEHLMSQYANLRPIITEGITHYYSIDENKKTYCIKPTADRYFKVRYRAVEEYDKEDDRHVTDYGFEEMANRAYPCIKSLYDIYQIVHPRKLERI